MADQLPKSPTSKNDISENLDKNGEKDELFEVDGLGNLVDLEVEDMPESNELQERRKKTKSRLQEMAGMEQTESGSDEDDGDTPGLMALLQEANLSGRHFKFCCGVVFVILVLVAMFFGGRRVYDYYISRPATPEDLVVEDVTPDQGSSDVVNGTGYSPQDASLTTSFLLGTPTDRSDGSTQAGQDLGDFEVIQDLLADHMKNFVSLYQGMQVDVWDLLNHSTDRRGTLSDYSEELRYLAYQGRLDSESLRTESDALAQQYSSLETLKSEQEARFFQKMKDLDTYASLGALNQFTLKAQEVIALRAQFNARQKLISYLDATVLAAETRLKDIELNEEALVKGVKVVDLSGSDLNLIIDEKQL